MNQTRAAAAKGMRRRRRIAFVVIGAMLAGLLTVAVASPASAQGCDTSRPFPWSSESDMTHGCVRNFIANPGVGVGLDPNKLTGPDGLLTPARVSFYVNQGFSENFLWFAPRTMTTTSSADTRLWTGCGPKNVDIPAGTTCGVDTPGGVIQGPMGPDFVGSGIQLKIIGDDTHFIALACGNFSIDVGPPPVPTPTIRVTKFRDDDRSGAQNAGEPELSGVSFRAGRVSSEVGQGTHLFSEIFVTDDNGQIEVPLVGHGPGRYYFEEIVPDGFDITTLPLRHTVDVPFGAADAYYDVAPFGNAPQPPEVSVDDHTLYEGETIAIDSAVVVSPAGFSVTYSWSPDDKLNDGSLLEPSFTGLDDAVDDITLTVSDQFGQSGSDVSRVTTLNLPPVPDIGPNVAIDENDTFTRTGLTYSDAGILDTHTGTVDYGDGTGPQPLALVPTGPGNGMFDLSHQYLDDDPSNTSQDDYTITVTITDDDGGVGQDTLTVTVNNLEPTAEAGGSEVINEGDLFERDLSFGDIGTLDTHSVTADFGEGAGFESVPIIAGTRTFRLSHLYADDDPTATTQDDYTVRVRVDDDDLGSVEDSFTVTVKDVAPDLEITSPSVDGELFAAPATINLVAPFTDPGTRDTFECRIDWDEGPATLDPPEPDTVSTAPFSGTSGNCDATNVFEQAGVYTIRVMVTDDDTLFDVEERMIVVYDPSAGFVTGGGYIDSPAGAYRPDLTLEGRATFGFVSKYSKRGVPEGNTEFQFHAGDLNFHSGDYDWLVVTANGTRAQYKGNGTINGAGDYGFMMTVYDNGEPGSGVDQLRLKIWDRATDDLVYDNRVGLSDDVDRADPQLITNGNIAIHTKGRNR